MWFGPCKHERHTGKYRKGDKILFPPEILQERRRAPGWCTMKLQKMHWKYQRALSLSDSTSPLSSSKEYGKLYTPEMETLPAPEMGIASCWLVVSIPLIIGIQGLSLSLTIDLRSDRSHVTCISSFRRGTPYGEVAKPPLFWTQICSTWYLRVRGTG